MTIPVLLEGFRCGHGEDTGSLSLAAITGQMGASIREISTNATEASRVVAQAVDVAGNAKTTVTQLGESVSGLDGMSTGLRSAIDQFRY